LYILNPSSFLKKTWTFISSKKSFINLLNIIIGFIDSETASKISMVTKNEYPQLLEKISGDQLLEKYGGTLREKTYW